MFKHLIQVSALKYNYFREHVDVIHVKESKSFTEIVRSASKVTVNGHYYSPEHTEEKIKGDPKMSANFSVKRCFQLPSQLVELRSVASLILETSNSGALRRTMSADNANIYNKEINVSL